MSDLAYSYMDWPRIEAIVYHEEASPRDVMAPRITPDGILIQGYFPDAASASVISSQKKYEMAREDAAGYFAAVIPGRKIPEYRFCVQYAEEKKEFYDAYAYPGTLTPDEEKAFLSGVFYEAYRKMGAHRVIQNGTSGYSFAVWAPNAVRVSLVGDFNHWDGRPLPMHKMPMSGIFELFIPGMKAGERYAYEIKTKRGDVFLKVDPYGACTVKGKPSDVLPLYSVTPPEEDFSWEDAGYLAERPGFADRDTPLSILELKADEWKDPADLVSYVKERGFTHVELLPVADYLPDSGEGYSTAAYFSVGMELGGASALKTLVNSLHKAGIGVICDWTPAQFSGFAGGLSKFDGTPLYEPTDPSAAIHPKWGTYLYNYDSPMVKDFLLSNACYLAEEFHMDGLRLDDVDAMLYLDYYRSEGSYQPNIYGTNENLAAVEFFKHLNSILHKKYPGILTIAQEDGLWPELTQSVKDDHPGFDYKWNGNWTSAFLSYLAMDPIYRKNDHDQLTLSMLYAYCEHYVLTLGRRDVGGYAGFMSKLFGSDAQKQAQIRTAFAYQYLHPGAKMITAMPDAPAELKKFLHDLNEIYREYPALSVLDSDYEGFEWIQLTRYDENVLAFLRKGRENDQMLLAVLNFSAVDFDQYAVGVPFSGKYKEIFNTDKTIYGGNGFTNPRVKASHPEECDERPDSIKVRLGALSAAIFVCSEA